MEENRKVETGRGVRIKGVEWRARLASRRASENMAGDVKRE